MYQAIIYRLMFNSLWFVYLTCLVSLHNEASLIFWIADTFSLI